MQAKLNLSDISWDHFDTILLDMDGTLLDLHYDCHFWFTHLPQRFQEIHGGDIEQIKVDLTRQIMAEKGKQTWYDLTFWSEQLNLDLLALKQEIGDLIGLLPSSLAFLNAALKNNKRMYITTNADIHSMHYKLQCTGIAHYFERCISAFEYEYPKEELAFWQALQEDITYEPERTLFVDDNEDVVIAARQAGLTYAIGLECPDSKGSHHAFLQAPSVKELGELLNSLNK